MEDSATNLTRPGRSAFTLVELLISLLLVSVVMGLAWIVLDSTRKVAEEINLPPESPLTQVWTQLEEEFDRLLPQPRDTEIPGLRFSAESGLEMVTLIPGPEGIPQQTELSYFIAENSLQKVLRRSYPPAVVTNVLIHNVTKLHIHGHRGELEIARWPSEPESPLPPRISVEIVREDGESSSREFYLPASFQLKKSTVPEIDP
ncbi:MAG: prepilin-type N-terminal cleavage/methylation domain-containing protein [Kiritimatiellia bacterium]